MLTWKTLLKEHSQLHKAQTKKNLKMSTHAVIYNNKKERTWCTEIINLAI